MIAVIVETRGSDIHPASLETLTIAQKMGDAITAVVAGARLDGAIAQLSSIDVREIMAIEDQRIQPGTSEALVAGLTSWIREVQPDIVMCPHSYSARDYAPRLAARLDRPLVTDCLSVRIVDGRRVFTRPLFQGKLVADVVLDGPPPHFATFQIGAVRKDDLQAATTSPRVTRTPADIAAKTTAVIIEPPFREVTEGVDLAHATRIVAAGRGIQGVEHLALIQELAAALGAEVAASRPVCDAGWLPLDRQVGSSGQTVAPSLYVAVGISGAIQHIVGMRGAKTVVAINKDPKAPIFEIADYAIVGDLFEIVPALIAALRSDAIPRA